MTLDAMIAVLQAARTGKPIQARHKRDNAWHDVTTPNWNFETLEWRVKPAPREFWVVPPSVGDRHSATPIFPDAAPGPDETFCPAKFIKVREVCD